MPTRQEREAIEFLRRQGRGHDAFWVRQVCILYGLPETDEMIGQIRQEATKKQ